MNISIKIMRKQVIQGILSDNIEKSRAISVDILKEQIYNIYKLGRMIISHPVL